MEYEIRSLKASDLFAVAGILGGIGIKEFKGAFDTFSSDDENRDTWGAVLEIASIILSNVEKVEEPLFKFLADVAGVKVSELRNASPGDFLDILVAVVQSDGFADFFTRVKSLI